MPCWVGNVSLYSGFSCSDTFKKMLMGLVLWKKKPNHNSNLGVSHMDVVNNWIAFKAITK